MLLMPNAPSKKKATLNCALGIGFIGLVVFGFFVLTIEEETLYARIQPRKSIQVADVYGDQEYLRDVNKLLKYAHAAPISSKFDHQAWYQCRTDRDFFRMVRDF